MKEIGISIYPFHSTLGENKSYIELASRYGYSRIFTCLLSVQGEKEKILKEFKEMVEYAKKFNMKVIADVAPNVFKELGITYENLDFFHKMGVYGIRLDIGFTGNEESLMTFNEYGLSIEINMSNNTHYVDTIMDFVPNREKLLGCHNFYPHRYTGLSREQFRECTKRFKKYALYTSAFVNSKNATFGPWPVDDGLCTLEEHRDLPIAVQGVDLFNEGIDCVIISNCFASEEELKALSEIRRDLLELEVELERDIPDIEKKIVLEELHFNRGDIGENLIRSTQPRVKYKNKRFDIFNAPEIIKKGDILVESSLYGHYAGEMQIALKEMKNSGKTNVVGRVKEEYIYLIDQIKPWQKFKLKDRK